MKRNDEETGWLRRPFLAWAVRIVLFVAPFLGGWAAIRLIQTLFFDPEGGLGVIAWIVQAVAVSVIASLAASRALRRLTPLPALLSMTLAFPDHAPSRFGVALRSGTTRKLLADSGLSLSSDVQEAAEQALVLVDQLSKHERLTRGHTERVRAHADLIGQELGLEANELNLLRWATLLHDVGKLKVPAEILSKPGQPTEAEWAVLRKHPEDARAMLAPLEPWLGEWALAASEHHERWDGQGYPDGLAGREISLAGRITAVADAYDVITSRRSYKPALPIEQGRQELVASAGTHFDPTIVRAMLEVGLHKRDRVNPLGWLLETRWVGRAFEVGIATPVAVAVAVVALGFPSSDQQPTELAFSEPIETSTIAPKADDVESAMSEPVPTVTSTVEETPSGVASPLPPEPESSLEPLQPTSSEPSTTEPIIATPSTNETTSTVAPAAPSTTASSTTPPSTVPPTDCEVALSGQTNLPNADLAGCDLSGLIIDGINFDGANLSNVDFSNITVQNFTMAGADFTGANLTGASFTDGSFASSAMTGVRASGLQLQRVNLADVVWRGAVLDDSVLREVGFFFGDFANASFQRADISLSQLQDASFVDANFANSTFRFVGFDRSDLTRSNFVGSSFESMTAVGAIHQATTCPGGMVTDITCF